VLAASQIALSIVLLAGAGLVSRTVWRLLDQATGFEPRNTVSLRLVMSDATTFAATSRVAFVTQVTQRVASLPGVQAAGIGSGLPPRIAPLSIGIRVVSDGRDEFKVLTLVSVTPDYLRALGARLLRGRMLQDADMNGGHAVALLSESAARHLSPRKDPIGQPLVFPLPPAVAGRNRRPQIVGVVGDIKYAGLDASTAGSVYVLWPDLPAGVGHLVVRTAGDPSAVVPSLRRVVRELDPTLPLAEVRTLDDVILSSIADRRLRLIPALSFAALALLVALVGLSASMTRAVAERRRELAIRGALGASPKRTLRMILGEGALVTGAGLLVGLGIAAALAGTLAQFLYGVTPRDPATFTVVAALVAAASLGVCYLAARRALRIDLLELLRGE
jgi:predicted permease